MKSTDAVNARAIKLCDVLGGLKHDLKHSDSLDIVSKLEGSSQWNTHTADISEQQRIAEQYLDEMLDAKAKLNYEKFVSRMHEGLLEHFKEKQFIRSIGYLREDLGPYVTRKYLGAINSSESPDTYPGKIRHIWRVVFENHEVFITLGIYPTNGVQYVCGFNFR